MQNIKAILGFPSGTPIDAVQAKVLKVWPRTEIPEGKYGPTSVQSAGIQDASGAKIKLKVWGHPDISKLEGQEVVIHASPKGKGLAVKMDKRKDGGEELILEAGKVSQFQTVAVYRQQNIGSPAAAPMTKSTGNSVHSIHGATAGSAVNNAITLLGDQALDLARKGELEDAIVSIGSQIVRAALRLEAGEGVTKEDEAKPAEVAPVTGKPAAPASQEDLEEEIPF